MKPLQGLALLLLMQSAGEALSHFLQLPVPGPVVGMVLLLLALRWAPVQQAIAPAAGFLLTHLSLLFVPVGVGVMTHLALLGTHGLRLVVAVTALVLRLWQTPAPTPPKAGDAELR